MPFQVNKSDFKASPAHISKLIYVDLNKIMFVCLR